MPWGIGLLEAMRGFSSGKRRFLMPIAILASAKALAASFIHSSLGKGGWFWMRAWGRAGPPEGSLAYLFCGFDSGWYVDIAKNGYAYPKYVFMPAYPALIRALGSILGDYWWAAISIAWASSFASLPLFQAIAERYMDRVEAMWATLLMASFPHVFAFTSLAYSEPLFLLLCLGAWLSYLRDAMPLSAAAMGMAALSRPYGVMIAIPIALDLLKKRDFGKMAWLSIPLGSLAFWGLFCHLFAGDWMATLTQQGYWAKLGMPYGIIRTYLWGAVFGGERSQSINYYLIAFVAIMGYLAFSSARADWRLGAFASAGYLVLLAIGTLPSLSRFISFLFPIWLSIRIKSPIAGAAALAISLPFGLALWLWFLQGSLIG
jgi:hypothetical protein